MRHSAIRPQSGPVMCDEEEEEKRRRENEADDEDH